MFAHVEEKINQAFKKEGSTYINIDAVTASSGSSSYSKRAEISYDGIQNFRLGLFGGVFDIGHRITGLPNEQELWETRHQWKDELLEYINDRKPDLLTLFIDFDEIEISRGSIVIVVSASVVTIVGFIASILGIIVALVQIGKWIKEFFENRRRKQNVLLHPFLPIR